MYKSFIYYIVIYYIVIYYIVIDYIVIYYIVMDTIVIVILVLIGFLLMSKCSRDGFSLSKKPMETEWSLLNHNPFDEIDYDTPTFRKI